MSTPDPFADDPLFGNKTTSDPFANDPLFSSPAGGVAAPVVPPVVSPPPAATPQLETPDDPFANDPLLQELSLERQRIDGQYEALRETGDLPELDQPQPGFLSSLKAGTAGIVSSLRTFPLEVIGRPLTELAEATFPGSDFANYLREQITLDEQLISEGRSYVENSPVSDTLRNLSGTDDLREFGRILLESEEKLTVVTEVQGLSVPYSAGLILGAAVGKSAGAFTASFLMSWGHDYHNSIAAGKDRDTALMDATKKALVQAGFDASALGIAGIRLFGNGLLELVAQQTIQAIFGGGAEALKHELVSEEWTLGEALIEAGGEFTNPMELIFAKSRAKPSDRLKTLEEVEKDFALLARKRDIEGMREELNRLVPILQERIATAADEEVGAVEGLDAPIFGEVGQAGVPIRTTNIWKALTQVVNPETNNIEYLAEHDWINDPIALTKETHNNTQIQDLEISISMLEQELNAPATTLTTEVAEELESKLRTYRRRKAVLEFRREQEFDFARKAQSMLREWVEALAPDMRVVFSTNHAGEVLAGMDPQYSWADIKSSQASGVLGQLWRSFDDEGAISIIQLDLENVIQPNGAMNEGRWVETLTHEFGHALFRHVWNQQTAQTKSAIKKGWLKWAKTLLDEKNTLETYYAKRYAPITARSFLGPFAKANIGYDPRGAYQNRTLREKVYAWGIDEYLANQVAKALQSNEQIAKPARPFFDEVISKLKELFELVKGRYRTTDSVEDFINLLASNVALEKLKVAESFDTLSQDAAIAEAREVVTSVSKALGLKPPRKPPPGVFFPHEEDNINGAIDRYGFFSKVAFGIIQIQDRNPHITGLRKYVENINRWWTDKMKFIARADERLHEWRGVGDKRAAAVGAFMQDLTVLSYEENKSFGPNDKEFQRLVAKYKLDQEQLDMVAKIEGDFRAVLDELFAVLEADIRRQQDPVDRGKNLDKLKKDFDELRNRNFFPLSRFGEYYLRVKAKQDMVYQGKEYKEGDVITFQMFEGGTFWSNFRTDTPPALKRAEKPFRDNALFEVSSGVVNDTQREFAGLPPQLLEMMRDRLELNDTQKKELDNLLRDIAPGRSFTKHMKTRKNVPGYSSDALRAYADYFMHFGNYVARIKYKGILMDNIAEVRDSANIIAEKQGSAVKRGRIVQDMQRHFDYAMNPDNEWANLRAMGFLWYLGFVPKSAFVNLTQVPLVTYPYLGARFGDATALAHLGRANKEAFKSFRNKGLREDQHRLIDYLIDTGIIEESMATELAAVAEGRALSRTATNTLFGSQKAGSALRTMAGYGSWMFQTAERFNRRVTALAAYELALKRGIPIRNQKGKLTGEFRPVTEREAFRFAHQAVIGTQFEYARFNRPLFMRGKKSVFFLFWNYMQNMLYFVGNDPGASRYIVLMLLAAGLSGLPFAEDAMDLYDFLAKKLNKHFKDDSFLPVNIRKELRSFVAELGANPDLVMHGASRYSMGLPFLADAVGLPMPLVDVSGSISMGRIIPGIEQLTRSDTEMSADLGRAAEQAGGAVASIPLQLIYAVADDNPDSWRRWERAAPTMVQHLSKALRYTIRGEATTPEGAVIKDFHVPEDRMDLAQVIAQGLGFADTEVNRAQEEHYMKKDILAYYEVRRRLYLEDLAYARRTQDQKQFQIIMQDVRRFNRDLRRIGLGSLALGPATIRRSLRERTKKRALIEQGLPGGKRGVQVGRQVEEGFPEETTETLRQ